MTHSTGYGHGDSAFYVGQTPPQAKPKRTETRPPRSATRTCSATPARTPSTWTSPTPTSSTTAPASSRTRSTPRVTQPNGRPGRSRDNEIFWNNYNYFLPARRQDRLRRARPLGGLTINYPTGVGDGPLRPDDWRSRDNNVFGNFKWGVAAFSDPFVAAAVSEQQPVRRQPMGRDGTDPTQSDFFNDGSGGGNCFSATPRARRSTPGSGEVPLAQIYPPCPRDRTGPGEGPQRSARPPDQPRRSSPGYVTSTPPAPDQEALWVRHAAPAVRGCTPDRRPGTPGTDVRLMAPGGARPPCWRAVGRGGWRGARERRSVPAAARPSPRSRRSSRSRLLLRADQACRDPQRDEVKWMWPPTSSTPTTSS